MPACKQAGKPGLGIDFSIYLFFHSEPPPVPGVAWVWRQVTYLRHSAQVFSLPSQFFNFLIFFFFCWPLAASQDAQVQSLSLSQHNGPDPAPPHLSQHFVSIEAQAEIRSDQIGGLTSTGTEPRDLVSGLERVRPALWVVCRVVLCCVVLCCVVFVRLCTLGLGGGWGCAMGSAGLCTVTLLLLKGDLGSMGWRVWGEMEIDAVP